MLQCLPACDDDRAAAAPPPSVLGTEDFVSSLGQQGEQASVANFGIPVRSFSSCSGETEEKKQRYLKETEENLKKHMKETREKNTFSFFK